MGYQTISLVFRYLREIRDALRGILVMAQNIHTTLQQILEKMK